MEKYDNKWIMNSSTTCEQGASSPATLGLSNMAGRSYNHKLWIGVYHVLWFIYLLCLVCYPKQCLLNLKS